MYKPEYDQVARLLNTEPRKGPRVWVGRVDCAVEGRLCDRFRIPFYPVIKFGLATQFLNESKNEPPLAVMDGEHTCVSRRRTAFMEIYIDVEFLAY